MKNLFKILTLVLALTFFSEKAQAYLVPGGAYIVWNGNPWTATSGTVHCYYDPMIVCCSINGTSIAININGHWWWGTIEGGYYDPETGNDPWWMFSESGLVEGPDPN